MKAGRLIARVAIGGLFVGHGTQKLFGWFDGPGLDKAARTMESVHLKNGFWAANGGYEFNLALIAALLALVDGGPGELSVDGALGIHDTGAGWALFALAAGAAGSTAVIELGRRQDAVEPGAQPPATETATNDTVSVA